MNGCTVPGGAFSARAMIDGVDCFLETTVQSGYATLVGPGSAFSALLTGLLTLYVAFIGYGLIFGRVSLQLSETAPRMILIGAVLALTSSWAAYQTVIYGVLTDGPSEIASMVGGRGMDGRGLVDRVDAVSTAITRLADNVPSTDAAALVPDDDQLAEEPVEMNALQRAEVGAMFGAREVIAPLLLVTSALILVMSSAGVIAITKVLLGLMLLLGPVFIALALFSQTRGLTLGWARAALLVALIPLLSAMATVGGLAILEPTVIATAASASSGVLPLQSVFAILIVTLLMAAVTLFLFVLARTIVNGWDWPATQAPRSEAGMAAAAPAATTVISPLAEAPGSARTQAMVQSISRAEMLGAPSGPSRAIVNLTTTRPAAGAQSANASGPSRTIAGRSRDVKRAPIVPVRSAA
ncbi:MAG: type IV secretion system protein [Pseudomonadota bacterium]